MVVSRSAFVFLININYITNPNALVAVSKGMRAVKFAPTKSPVLNWRCRLTQADLCVMAVKQWLLYITNDISY